MKTYVLETHSGIRITLNRKLGELLNELNDAANGDGRTKRARKAKKDYIALTIPLEELGEAYCQLTGHTKLDLTT